MTTDQAGARIRALEPDDRSKIEQVVRSTGNFNEAEIAVALELVDAAVARGEDSGYVFAVMANADTVLGYACYGQTPMTVGTWDLYWIAVRKTQQGSGCGQRLLRHAEEDVRTRGGRLLLIETSSQESYGATRSFYDRAGYALAATIPEYYKPGDDKLVFLKRL
jgi:ribosomal protein S18 acetylase RimI-like enzyme